MIDDAWPTSSAYNISCRVPNVALYVRVLNCTVLCLKKIIINYGHGGGGGGGGGGG